MEVEEDEWLLVSVSVMTPHGGWSIPGNPALTAGDVVMLARWLQALGQGRRQADELSFLEPNLSFHRRWDTRPDVITLRVGLQMEMAPPPSIAAACGQDARDFSLTFTLSPQQVVAAGASLEEELRNLLEPGDDGAPLFALPSLAPNFFASWVFLSPAASSHDEAIETVKAYMTWADMPVLIEDREPEARGQDGGLVRARTELPVPSDDYDEALYRLLSHIPMPYGMPYISRPMLSENGRFHCDLFLIPRASSSDSEPFSTLRWRCALMNFASDDLLNFDAGLALAYLTGEVDVEDLRMGGRGER